MKKEKLYDNASYQIATDTGSAPVFEIIDGKFKKTGLLKNGEKVSGIAYQVTTKNKKFNVLDAGGKYIPYQNLTIAVETKSEAEGKSEDEDYDNTIGEYKDKIKKATKTLNWSIALPITVVGGGIVYVVAGKIFPSLPKWATIGIGIAGGIGSAMLVNKMKPSLYKKKDSVDKKKDDDKKDTEKTKDIPVKL